MFQSKLDVQNKLQLNPEKNEFLVIGKTVIAKTLHPPYPLISLAITPSLYLGHQSIPAFCGAFGRSSGLVGFLQGP